MLELASLGTVVLHNRSVELAKKYNIKLVVKSSFNDNLGSLIGDEKINVFKIYVFLFRCILFI